MDFCVVISFLMRPPQKGCNFTFHKSFSINPDANIASNWCSFQIRWENTAGDNLNQKCAGVNKNVHLSSRNVPILEDPLSEYIQLIIIYDWVVGTATTSTKFSLGPDWLTLTLTVSQCDMLHTLPPSLFAGDGREGMVRRVGDVAGHRFGPWERRATSCMRCRLENVDFGTLKIRLGNLLGRHTYIVIFLPLLLAGHWNTENPSKNAKITIGNGISQ